MKKSMPRIGMRIIKTSIAAFLILLIFTAVGAKRSPFYVLITTIICIQPDIANTKDTAFNRAIGTLIGAVTGAVAMLLEMPLKGLLGGELWWDLLNAVMICITIYLTVLLGKQYIAFMACVAYLSVAVIAHDGVSPYEFLFYRVVDTFLGVGIGSLVGSFHTHGKKRNDVLFVAELDDELRSAHRQISEFNKTALNHMIDEGALFTMITRQTPASLIAEVEHLKLRLPVIALDGAVLYDIYQNRYLHACLMEHDMGLRIRQLLTEQNRAFFTNVIVDDVWVIYYNDLVDEDQKGYLKKLRTSPYRNYMKRAPHDEDHILYFSVLDTHNRLIMLEKQLEEMGFAGKLKFLLEDHVFGEKSLLKILSIEASPRNMLDRLMKMLHVHHSIVYGDKDSETCCDVAVADSDFNRIVQNIRADYTGRKRKTRVSKKLEDIRN